MSTADSKSQLVVDLGDWVPPSGPLAAPAAGATVESNPPREHASSLDVAGEANVRPSRLSRHQSGPIYLDGEVLACACPECGSPMSIRLWLMLADCWHCGTSVELTEEQEREAQRILAERQPPPANSTGGPWAQPLPRQPVKTAPAADAEPEARAAPPTPPILPPVAATRPAAKTFSQVAPPARTTPRAAAARTAARPTPAVLAAKRVRQRLQAQQSASLFRRIGRGIFRSMPSWLTSLILHMVALIVLGLWTIPKLKEERLLILATQVGPEDQAGGIDDIARSDDPESFQDPGSLTPRDVEASENLKQEGVEEAEFFNPLPMVSDALDGPQLVMPVSALPISAGQGIGSIYLGRDPKARAGLVRSAGGTIVSEAAVARGLEWISWHQSSDGSWSLDQFHKAGKCEGRCGQLGTPCDTAGTALALLPFLGAGQTHKDGKYMAEVRSGLEWLVKHQKSDGNLWTGGMQLSQMYAHGQAAIALCEAFALTQDSYLRAPAQASLDFIVKAQHSGGGWRYQPGSEGDTSVVGWQVMALRSGQLAGLDVPVEAFELASKFLNSVQDDTTGAKYGYQPGHSFSPTMTAEALLCRQYAGWPRNHPGLATGTRNLIDKHSPRPGPSNMYYWYYATQVMHHLGGEAWEDWNPPMRDLLTKTQETKGHQAGSWQPTGNYDPAGGRLYMTALAVCTLEVYYRHLPLYQDAALEKGP